MDLLEKQPKETARDYAVRVIRHNIVKLRLQPGTMVSENELATEMGLSRTPIREALIELSKSGIVEIYPQHGSMVSKIDYDKVEEASFTRRVVETAVVREVCGIAAEDDIARLDENISLQRLYLERNNTDKLMVADNDFHRMLFAIAKKPLSFELIRTLAAHFDRVREMSLMAVKHLRIVEDHAAIFDAIKARDPDRAAVSMHMHLSRYQLDKEAIYEKYSRYFAD
ncbi:MAG: GntR family transcriptional regulator [Planctomycetaceae bacterium]|nr:GntR family transcriptional regulator [Planctomycetaceae bacterium]